MMWVNVIRVLLLPSSKHLRDYELKKNVTYKINPAWYKPLIPPFTARQKIIETKTNCITKTCKIGEKKGGMVA